MNTSQKKLNHKSLWKFEHAEPIRMCFCDTILLMFEIFTHFFKNILISVQII